MLTYSRACDLAGFYQTKPLNLNQFSIGLLIFARNQEFGIKTSALTVSEEDSLHGTHKLVMCGGLWLQVTGSNMIQPPAMSMVRSILSLSENDLKTRDCNTGYYGDFASRSNLNEAYINRAMSNRAPTAWYDLTNKAYVDSRSGGIVASSYGQNGYVRYADGYMVQWGRATVPATGGTVSFPTGFPNATRSVVASIETNVSLFQFRAANKTRFSYFASFPGATTSTAIVINWRAEGY